MSVYKRWIQTLESACDYRLNQVVILCIQYRLAPVLKTFFHQCVISYTCSQSNSGGSVCLKTEPSELDWLQEYDMTH